MFVQVLSAFALTALLLIMLAPLAHKFGLVDRPSARKQHDGEIPLIGGVAMFFTLLILVPIFSPFSMTILWYLAACALLVLVGILDDRLNMKVGLRVAVEVTAALMMIYGGKLWVGSLGNLLGVGELYMPVWFSTPFTIIAVFGITNAWNMIDGLDGLVGTITLIALASFYLLTHGSAPNNVVTTLLIGGTAAYLLFNLMSSRLLPKVFLGDAGSKLIGFSLVWLLIDSTQSGEFTRMQLPAVLALFVVGLPLMDMVATTVRRMRKGMAPFQPDRTHIHHILQHAGFTQQEILLLIGVLTIVVNLLGISMYLLKLPAWIQFGMFLVIVVLYFLTVEHAWKLAKWLQKQQESSGS